MYNDSATQPTLPMLQWVRSRYHRWSIGLADSPVVGCYQAVQRDGSTWWVRTAPTLGKLVTKLQLAEREQQLDAGQVTHG